MKRRAWAYALLAGAALLGASLSAVSASEQGSSAIPAPAPRGEAAAVAAPERTAPAPRAADAPPDLVQQRDPWFESAAARLSERLARRPIEGRAKNVILMIADGAGVATLTAIRLHMGQAAGGLGEEAEPAYERFPHSALVKTYTVNAQTGDGAATATALMAGVKTKSGVLGLDQTARRGDCGRGAPLTRIGDLFAADGRAVGYVTTARITHATPAAGYAAAADRLWEHDGVTPPDCLGPDIAQQLAARMTAGEIQLALGGGREAFLPADRAGAQGARRDGRDLLAELGAAGVRTVSTADGLASVDLSVDAPLLGLFAPRSMAYEHDRVAAAPEEPALAAMTEAAVASLRAASGDRGFFLMVEGGRVGQAGHWGNLQRAATDGAAFADAVARAAALTDPRDTLIIVTADASHSLAFNGYCGRGAPVPGLCYGIDPEGPGHAPEPALAADGAPYETTGYLNGPGAAPEGETAQPAAADPAPALRNGRRAPTAETARDPDRRQAALIPMRTATASAADVAAYARGPWAHLVSGAMEQHELFHVMRHAAFGAPAAPAD